MRALAVLFLAGCAATGPLEVAEPCSAQGAYRVGLAGQTLVCPQAPEAVVAAYDKGVNYGELSREIVRLERLAQDIRDGRISRLGFKSRNITPFGRVSGARRALIAIDDADRLEAFNDVRDRIRYLRKQREAYAFE